MIILAKNFNLIENSYKDPLFFGMKVSKKLSKKAPIRNKIKRRIRHLMRLIIKDSEINCSKMALIFIPYKNFHNIRFANLFLELKKILKP